MARLQAEFGTGASGKKLFRGLSLMTSVVAAAAGAGAVIAAGGRSRGTETAAAPWTVKAAASRAVEARGSSARIVRPARRWAAVAAARSGESARRGAAKSTRITLPFADQRRRYSKWRRRFTLVELIGPRVSR